MMRGGILLRLVFSCLLVRMGDSASIPSACSPGYRYDISLRECVPMDDADVGEPTHPGRRDLAGRPMDPPVPRADHGTEHSPGDDGRRPPGARRPGDREVDSDAARRAADSGAPSQRGRTDDRHMDHEPELCSHDMDEDAWDSWDEDEYDDVMYGGSDWYDDGQYMDDMMYDRMMDHERIYNRMMDEMYRRYDMYNDMYDMYDGGMYDDWDDMDDIDDDGPCSGTGDWDQWDEPMYDEDMRPRGDERMSDGDVTHDDEGMGGEDGDMMCDDDGDDWTCDEEINGEDMDEDCSTMDDRRDDDDDVYYCSTDAFDMVGGDPQDHKPCGEIPEDHMDDWTVFDDMRLNCGCESGDDHDVDEDSYPESGVMMGDDCDAGRDEEMPAKHSCDMAPEFGTIPNVGSIAGISRYVMPDFAAPSLYGDGMRDAFTMMSVLLDKAMHVYDGLHEDDVRHSHCLGYNAGRRSLLNSTSCGEYPGGETPDDQRPPTRRPDPPVGPQPITPSPTGPQPGMPDRDGPGDPTGPIPDGPDGPSPPGPQPGMQDRDGPGDPAGPIHDGPDGPSPPGPQPGMPDRDGPGDLAGPIPDGEITIPDDILETCTFNHPYDNQAEDSYWCRFARSGHNRLRWLLTNRRVSRERSDGPQSDYNTQDTTRNGYYAYISGNNNREERRDKLLSPTFNTGEACLTFWYYIYGGNASLRVDLKYSPARNQTWPSLELGGVTGGWRPARMSLPAEPYYLEFVYISGQSSSSESHTGVAIDDIIIVKGAC